MLNKRSATIHVQHLSTAAYPEKRQLHLDCRRDQLVFQQIAQAIRFLGKFVRNMSVSAGFDIPAASDHEAIQTRQHVPRILGTNFLRWQDNCDSAGSCYAFKVEGREHGHLGVPNTGLAPLAVAGESDYRFHGTKLPEELFALEVDGLRFDCFLLVQILCPDCKRQPQHLHHGNYSLGQSNNWLAWL